METADFDVQDFDQRYAGDKSVYVKFYIHPVRDNEASSSNGRPMFKDVEYVEIRAAGNQNNIIQRPVTKMDIDRFQEHYRRFKDGMSEQVIGTRLTEVPWITRSQVEELAHIRIYTLEALSAVPEDVCQRMAGLRDLKMRAATMLEAAEKAAPFTALEAENKELKNQVEAMANQLKELMAAVKAGKKE